jgi:hypothetical protein
VGWRGRAIVIPGPSHAGKSRLVEALVRSGATYYSDEFAALDEAGQVHPYAQQIKLRLDHGGVRHVRPEDLNAPVGAGPIPIGLVVTTAFDATQRWQARAATSGEAVLGMLANTVRARLAPRATLKTLARAVDDAEALTGPRGEADDTARALLDWFDACGPGRDRTQRGRSFGNGSGSQSREWGEIR